MRLREIGWITFLAGLPFSHLIFSPFGLDLWHSHALWAQFWIITLWATSLTGTPNQVSLNRSLAGFIIWIAWISLFRWTSVTILQKVYPLPMLQGLLHIVLLVMFYQAAVNTWDANLIRILLRAMCWSGALLLAYCFIQMLNLDEFLKSTQVMTETDVVVGTVGNPSHLAGQLSMLTGLFLLQPEAGWKLLALAATAIVLMTKSMAGQLAIYVVWCIWVAYEYRKWLWLPIVAGIAGLAYLCLHPDLLSSNGRLAAWQQFWKIFKFGNPLTGRGAGYIMEFSKVMTAEDSPIFNWRHVHNEYFQLAIEYGLIGVGFLLGMFQQLVRRIAQMGRKPAVIVSLCSVLAAFFINSLLNYPAHLWTVGHYALVAYCGLYVLSEKVNSGVLNEQNCC